MDTDINQIIAPLVLCADEPANWPPLQLRVRTYLTSTQPPLDLVTSVRAVVTRNDEVLVVRDPVNVHILPGGRREVDETLEQTLRREVLEETGWTIGEVRLIGLMHYQHITPKPDGYRYPYPDFVHLIYTATAEAYDASQREVDGYELEANFQPMANVPALTISQGERALLQAALSNADNLLAIRNNDDLIRCAYAAFNRRDIDAALALMHADVEWPNGMEGGYVYGHVQVRDYWTRQWTMIDPHVEPEQIATGDDGRVMVHVHQVVRALDGAVLNDRMITHVYRIDDRLVRHMEIREQ